MKHRYLIIGILLLGLLVGGVQATTYLSAYDGYKVLSDHLNESSFSDVTGKNVTATSVTLNTTDKKFGAGCGDFGNTSSLTLSDNASWVLGSTWTSMIWVKMTTSPTLGAQYLWGQYQDGTHDYSEFIDTSGHINFYVYNAGYTTNVIGTSVLSPNIWYQIVTVQSNATTTKIYINGIEESYSSTTSAAIPDFSGTFYIGHRSVISYYHGKIDEYNLWKGSTITIGELYPQTYEVGQEIVTIPVASFTPTGVTTGTAPLAVTFTDTSTNTRTYWNWTYQGYGTNTTTGYNWSTLQNVTATFTTGNFSISHGAGNAAGFNLSTQITWVNVTNPIPIVSFTANVTSGIAPLAVALNDTSTGNMTSRFWDFGDNTNSTVASPTHTYTIAGTYIVNLTEINLDVSNSTTKTITVYNPANSQFSSYNTAGTAPFSTYLYDLSTNTTPGPDTYYWMFGDGNTSTSQSLYYTWNITGTYAVNHSFSNGASTSWNNKSAYITVGTPTPPVIAPVASFYGGPQIGAPPLLVYLTDVSTNTPTSWNWSFGDGTYGITQNPSHWYNSSGFFTVGLTATNSAGSNTTSQNNFIMVY